MLSLTDTARSRSRSGTLLTLALLPLLTVMSSGLMAQAQSPAPSSSLRYPVNMTAASPVTVVLPNATSKTEEASNDLARLGSQLLYTIGLYRLQNLSFTEREGDGWAAPRDPFSIESTVELVHAVQSTFLRTYASGLLNGSVTDCIMPGQTALFSTWHSSAAGAAIDARVGEMTVRVKCVDGLVLGANSIAVDMLTGLTDPVASNATSDDADGVARDPATGTLQLVPFFNGTTVNESTILHPNRTLRDRIQILNNNTVRLENGSIVNVLLNSSDGPGAGSLVDLLAPVLLPGAGSGPDDQPDILYANGTVVEDVELVTNNTVRLPNGDLIHVIPEDITTPNDTVTLPTNGTMLANGSLLLSNGTVLNDTKIIDDNTVRLPNGMFIDLLPNNTQPEAPALNETSSTHTALQGLLTNAANASKSAGGSLNRMLFLGTKYFGNGSVLLPNGSLVEADQLAGQPVSRDAKGSVLERAQTIPEHAELLSSSIYDSPAANTVDLPGAVVPS
ncbi:hypothetical protein THASP1DRAFT_23498 [Thamnocephalis sphaerospora]|uniref:FAS1 domain-containing protein n=1 Tax=Thamnocephalis sphaerospora TaxID=78915 RepID=A0A4P9XRF6_9FUNG|nr:hypothetical protein THASP1DRAFT_23498 [Thamnocephalis sphaerospora]|eukprot:RKP08522.1 hypothetical protein THASP1DRAFT_23498 [Thamnocephalis sphaerospora]